MQSFLCYNYYMKPTYKLIPGFPGYRVGDDGSVWTCRRLIYEKGVVGCKSGMGEEWTQMKASPLKKGHMHLILRRNNKPVHVMVHRLVLLAFVGPCPEGHEGAHENGIPSDNRLENLSWKTPSANQQDRIRHGTDSRGEKHGIASVTNAQARQVLIRFKEVRNQAKVAREFGISRYVVGRLVRGDTYVEVSRT